jgi:nuclease-like protein
MTVLKHADDKQPVLDALAGLLERPDVDERTRKRIQEEIWATRAGIQGERDAAYEIDFHYASRKSHAIIHDLRIELNGRVAQIDHLLINRVLDVWVCETKAFSQGVKVDEFGEWYRYGGKFAHGAPSPVKQVERHIEVLKEVFDKGVVQLPRRVVTLKPSLMPIVLISNSARIDRPKSKRARESVEGLDKVIKIEQLVSAIDRSIDERNPIRLLGKLVTGATVQNLGQQLVGLHRPAGTDWVAAKFGLAPVATPVQTAADRLPASPQRTADVATSASPERPCVSCGRHVSDKVDAYLRENPDEFGGRYLCFDCQRDERRARRRRAS